MLNPNWPSRFTYHGRYEDTGVTDRVYEYSSKTGKKNLKILDVGCSVAIATKSMQKNLLISGIHSETTGIDIFPDVQKEAEKNLNKFILGDILKIDLKPEYDVVICSKMVYFETAKRKATVLSQCSKFLQLNGGLITDAHNYEYPSFYEQMKENIVDTKKILWKLRSGLKASHHEWKGITELRFKRKVKLIMGKDNAQKYPKEILDRWKKLKPDEKFSYFLDILVGKFVAYMDRKPNYKKRGKNVSPTFYE